MAPTPEPLAVIPGRDAVTVPELELLALLEAVESGGAGGAVTVTSRVVVPDELAKPAALSKVAVMVSAPAGALADEHVATSPVKVEVVQMAVVPASTLTMPLGWAPSLVATVIV